MRPKMSRMINRQPVRSPSPDIANRSIIRETVAPINEIIRKTRTQSYGNMGWGDQGNQEWQTAVVQWQQKYRTLEEQITQLLIENSALKKEVNSLNEMLSQKEEDLSNSRDRQEPSEAVNEYQKRFAQLMEQIHRIQALLQQQKDKSNELQQQNSRIRYNPYQNGRNAKSTYPEDEMPSKLQQMQNIFNEEMEKMKKQMDLKVGLLLNGLEDRFIDIKKHQLQLESIIRKTDFSTPVRSEKGARFNESTGPSYHSRSPSDPNRSARANAPLEEEKKLWLQQIKDIEGEKVSLENELDKMGSAKHNLENKLNQTSDLVQNLMDKLQQNDRNIAELRLQIDKECPNCKNLLHEIGQMEVQLQQLKKVKKEGESSQKSLKTELQRQHESFSYNLEDYIQRIKDIKTSLSNQQFKELLQKMNEVLNENISLNSKVQKLLNEINVSKRQAKAKDIEQTIMINTLKRQNEVMNFQLQEQDSQISKLQDIIDNQLNEERNMAIVLDDVEASREKEKEGQPRMFEEYIEAAIKKLQKLQVSMETTLHQ